MEKIQIKEFLQLPSWPVRDPNGNPVYYVGPDGNPHIQIDVSTVGIDPYTHERIVADPNRVVAGIIRNTEELRAAEEAERERIKAEEQRAAEETEKGEAKEEKEPRKHEKRFRKVLLIPILMGAVLLGMLAYHFSQDDPAPNPEPPPGVVDVIKKYDIEFDVPIDVEFYHIDNPALDLSGNAGMKGQEEMTNQFIWKQILSYDQDRHADVERLAVSGFGWFEGVKAQIDECFSILGNPQATKEQKISALNTLIDLSTQIETYYRDNLSNMQQSR